MRCSPYLIVAAVAVLGLASCDRPAEPADAPSAGSAGFSHALTADLSGYYMPDGEARVGDWRLNHIFVGQAHEFEAWEAGTRGGTFGPVMLQFDDATSPMVQTEIGESHSITARVLPVSYAVTDTSVTFEGQSAELGRVTFNGRLDPGALATAKRNLGGDGVVMTGTLTAGRQTINGVRLRWWMGD